MPRVKPSGTIIKTLWTLWRPIETYEDRLKLVRLRASELEILRNKNTISHFMSYLMTVESETTDKSSPNGAGCNAQLGSNTFQLIFVLHRTTICTLFLPSRDYLLLVAGALAWRDEWSLAWRDAGSHKACGSWRDAWPLKRTEACETATDTNPSPFDSRPNNPTK